MYICSICGMKKNHNKNDKKCGADRLDTSTSTKMLSRKTSRLNSRWQIIYDRRRKKYRLVAKRAAIDEYVFYSVLNTYVAMELGIAASVMTRSILALHNELVADATKNPLVQLWRNSGENIIVLQGYGHKHLKYLNEEAKFVALGKHAVYHRWHHSRVMLALSVFGRKQELEEILYGLPYLR